jgi:tRNA nucleotidyltransferase (CCA-adding enzyme)
MTVNEYLAAVLKSQELDQNGPEMREIQTHRAAVETLISGAFPVSNPTIRYGGSRAKNTMIRESYDLDIICYFGADDDQCGSTLEQIFTNMQLALRTA